MPLSAVGKFTGALFPQPTPRFQEFNSFRSRHSQRIYAIGVSFDIKYASEKPYRSLKAKKSKLFRRNEYNNVTQNQFIRKPYEWMSPRPTPKTNFNGHLTGSYN